MSGLKEYWEAVCFLAEKSGTGNIGKVRKYLKNAVQFQKFDSWRDVVQHVREANTYLAKVEQKVKTAIQVRGYEYERNGKVIRVKPYTRTVEKTVFEEVELEAETFDFPEIES